MGSNGQLNSGSLYKQTRRNPLSRDVYSLWRITLLARRIPECLNMMVDALSRSNQTQSTEWSLHPQVFKQVCRKWFTPHVDLFVTCLKHKLPLYVSPIPDQHARDTDALNINWSGLVPYVYPPMGLLLIVIKKIRQCICHIIRIALGWPGMPWFWDFVQLPTELLLPALTTRHGTSMPFQYFSKVFAFEIFK